MEPPLIRVLLNDVVVEDFNEPISQLMVSHEIIVDLIVDTIAYQYNAIAEAIFYLHSESDFLRDNDELVKTTDLNDLDFECYIDNFNEFDCNNPLYEYEEYGNPDDDDTITALMDLSLACSLLADRLRSIVVDLKLDGTFDVGYQVCIEIVLDYEYGVHFAYLS